MAITLTSYEENMYTNYYDQYITKIPSKGISNWSMNLTESVV